MVSSTLNTIESYLPWLVLNTRLFICNLILHQVQQGPINILAIHKYLNHSYSTCIANSVIVEYALQLFVGLRAEGICGVIFTGTKKKTRA